jgi:3-methyladenine DNA glycosylase AlkD
MANEPARNIAPADAMLAQIEAALRPLADAQQAVPMRAYMLNQFAFLGIRATPRRQALRGLPKYAN